MSHYYSIHTNLKLKLSTPAYILDFFDILYKRVQDCDLPDKCSLLIEQPYSAMLGVQLNNICLTELVNVIQCTDSDVPAYCEYGKKDNSYYSYSSSRYDFMEEFNILFNSVIPYLDVPAGHVLFRSVWYESSTENILYLSKDGKEIYGACVNSYSNTEPDILHEHHPRNFIKGANIVFPYTNFFNAKL